MKLSKLDFAAGVLVTIVWGCNFSVIELGLRSLDPYLLTLLRFTFCAIPLVFFIRRPAGISFYVLALYGVLFGAGLWWMVNFAMYQGLSPGMSSVFLQFSAFFTIIFSSVLLKERITTLHGCGMLLAVVGLMIILLSTDASSTPTGIALILVAALAWSFCNLLVKFIRPVEMMAFIIWSSLFSVPAIFALTLVAKGWEPFSGLAESLSWGAVFSIGFQSYITTILGYLVWNNLMKKYPATTVAPLSLLVPVSGLLASHVFFGEEMSQLQGVAIGVVLLGILIFLNAHALQSFIETRSNTA
ncbi:O-acetylserine/cysteine efflux transporter [Pseudomonas hunanensis]|uniref:O-acetylserine/cysteine efflux transporter n=1 Tax=Pseudomonas hunanensis TaxID=1247546 RepID=A0ACC6K9F3_9PSED|nr:EamA family transporter [Pseudomonas hunanensis]MDR6715030.1 O-acetylserine/cysteine efflux transporter [Pseudomonas hunanensis]